MKALVCTGPEKLEYSDWPDPRIEPGDALVRVRTVGVCGSDLRAWRCQTKRRVPPFILGHELAGDVGEIRDSHSAVQRGDRVAIFPLMGCHACATCQSGRDQLCSNRRELGLQAAGAYAEYLKIPARNLYKIPEKVGYVAGALIEPVSVGVHMASLAAGVGGTALVLGAGPIGLVALQAAALSGFGRIAVAEINAHRAEVAAELGAALVMNPKEEGAIERLREFFGAEGCAVVFDAVGFSATRQMALKLVRTGGTIVLAGGGEGESSLDFIDVICREVRIQGSFAYSRKDFETAIEWIAHDRVNLEGWVSEAALADGQRVFEELVQPESKHVKIVLRP